MKTNFNFVQRSQIGPLGILLLALIFIVTHSIAIGFKQYGVLPLFYGLVFFAIVVSHILGRIHRKPK